MNTLAVPSSRVKTFIGEVFFNLDEILAHHQRMLAALFARQRDQFPLVQSVADIVLDSTYLPMYPMRLLSVTRSSLGRLCRLSALPSRLRGVHKALPHS